MNNNIFKKLAADNIKRNNKSYIPYILSCIVTVAVFYIMKSLSLNPGLKTMIGADTISALMYLGSIVAALFALVFLLYANSFPVKRRKKEWGVFNILGMERRHIAKTLAWEMFYVYIISLSAGLILGIALDKVMFLLIIKVIGGTITLGFSPNNPCHCRSLCRYFYGNIHPFPMQDTHCKSNRLAAGRRRRGKGAKGKSGACGFGYLINRKRVRNFHNYG